MMSMSQENTGENVGGIDIQTTDSIFSNITPQVYDIGLGLIPLVYLISISIGVIIPTPIKMALLPASIIGLLIMGTLLFIFYPYRHGDT